MLRPRLDRHIVRRRNEYERRVRDLVKAGIACRQFVSCDPKLIVFAMLGAMTSIPKWYVPEGPMTSKDIAEASAAYLTRGLLAARTAPVEGLGPVTKESDAADRRRGARAGAVAGARLQGRSILSC